ncbi:NAD(P)/FAD-dependent oxidoreductase [Paenibacillus borealis]|uniref:Pyridine nucleotide-disulfide oxidoreductase n=1 Tax=Paenibacillus borealis TaxID=160799 RepID=A0A089L472_PAEBO|nr:FAD-dependent oxidoreductase [Paenibacillus borealis]AIQ56281.1 pyridine nucleotide-disulfide oxidoreductase [Paenibacillus borealis]
MKEWTCVVVGGGYAGIHAVKEIRQTFKEEKTAGHKLRIILVDQNPYHLRKVLLFRVAAGNEQITIPLKEMFPQGVEFLQAAVTRIVSAEKRLLYTGAEGEPASLSYDILILAAGSIVRGPGPGQGGMVLSDPEAAGSIRESWRANLKQAAIVTESVERQRLMTIVVAGAGISGIETSAELAFAVREEARQLGLDPDGLSIQLINASSRLFPEGPVKVGLKLEQVLGTYGVEVKHERKVVSSQAGTVALDDGTTIPAGLCIWTLGLQPSPMLGSLGLPLTPGGFICVDASYRVHDAPGVYSIGDCARIAEPGSGHVDGKTCKEAIGQASRLAKIIWADISGRPAPEHKAYMTFFCFGLGPGRGMAWTHQWGLDILITGRLGWRLRKFTWDAASFLK